MVKAPTSIPPPRAWAIITTERTRMQRERLADEIARIADERLRTRLRRALSRLMMFIENDMEQWLAKGGGPL